MRLDHTSLNNFVLSILVQVITIFIHTCTRLPPPLPSPPLPLPPPPSPPPLPPPPPSPPPPPPSFPPPPPPRQAIKDELDATFNCGVFSFEGKKTADVASLFKQLIRDLPVPLLTRENLPAFAAISDISNLKERVRTLNLLVLMLPTLHQRVLKVTLGFGFYYTT